MTAKDVENEQYSIHEFNRMEEMYFIIPYNAYQNVSVYIRIKGCSNFIKFKTFDIEDGYDVQPIDYILDVLSQKTRMKFGTDFFDKINIKWTDEWVPICANVIMAIDNEERERILRRFFYELQIPAFTAQYALYFGLQEARAGLVQIANITDINDDGKRHIVASHLDLLDETIRLLDPLTDQPDTQFGADFFNKINIKWRDAWVSIFSNKIMGIPPNRGRDRILRRFDYALQLGIGLGAFLDLLSLIKSRFIFNH
eukprot:727313_1